MFVCVRHSLIGGDDSRHSPSSSEVSITVPPRLKKLNSVNLAVTPTAAVRNATPPPIPPPPPPPPLPPHQAVVGTLNRAPLPPPRKSTQRFVYFFVDPRQKKNKKKRKQQIRESVFMFEGCRGMMRLIGIATCSVTHNWYKDEVHCYQTIISL